MGHMATKVSEDIKAGERTQFCYNCKFQKKKPKQKYCVDCFGKDEKTGNLFCYVNWEESKDYHKRVRIK